MNSDQEFQTKVRVTGPMPPFVELAYAVWGHGADFDSDGDSVRPDSTSWTELTLILRPGHNERVDIDPCEDDDTTLRIRATSHQLLEGIVGVLLQSGAVAHADTDATVS